MTFHRTGDLVLCPFTSSWALGWFPPPGSWEQCTPFSLCLSGSSSISVSVLKLDRGHSAPCGSPSGGFPLLCGGLALRPCSTSALGPSPALRPPQCCSWAALQQGASGTTSIFCSGDHRPLPSSSFHGSALSLLDRKLPEGWGLCSPPLPQVLRAVPCGAGCVLVERAVD